VSQTRFRSVVVGAFVFSLALALFGPSGGCGDDDQIGGDAQVVSDVEVLSDAEVPADAHVPDPFDVTERVEVVTSMGTFVLSLYGNGAPQTVGNFLRYVDEGAYEDTMFHRVIPDFMIQGGGMYADWSDAPRIAPIPLEIMEGLSHLPGVISMARTDDPDSATNQFFICVADDSGLDDDYAAFGEVESGYDVVLSIAGVRTETVGGYEDVPVTAVIIESATRIGAP